MSELDSLLLYRKRYVRIVLILAFAFALLHAIHSFFFTLLFWSMLGMGIMALYYHIMYKASQRGNQSFQDRSQGQRATQKTETKTTTYTAKNRVGMIVFFAIVGLFVFMMIFFISLFTDDDSGYDTTLSVEPEALIKARGFYDNEQYRDAIKTLRPLMTEEVNDVMPMLVLGDSYYNLQQFDSAYVWYNDAYELGERSPFLCHALAYMLDERGETDAAILLYKESLSLDSSRVDIYQRLSELEPENRDRYLTLKKKFTNNQ